MLFSSLICLYLRVDSLLYPHAYLHMVIANAYINIFMLHPFVCTYIIFYVSIYVRINAFIEMQVCVLRLLIVFLVKMCFF